MIDGYITVREAAEKWKVNPRTIQLLCAENKIEGVTKFGRAWAIPKSAEKPDDGRIKSGKYKNWRVKK